MTTTRSWWPDTIAAAGLAPDQEQGGLDDHQALEYMRLVLDQLAGDRAGVNL